MSAAHNLYAQIEYEFVQRNDYTLVSGFFNNYNSERSDTLSYTPGIAIVFTISYCDTQ